MARYKVDVSPAEPATVMFALTTIVFPAIGSVVKAISSHSEASPPVLVVDSPKTAAADESYSWMVPSAVGAHA